MISFFICDYWMRVTNVIDNIYNAGWVCCIVINILDDDHYNITWNTSKNMHISSIINVYMLQYKASVILLLVPSYIFILIDQW